MDVSIVIVTYNSAKHIGGLLTSIAKSKDGLKKEVIVIDNSSSDNSAKIARLHPLKPKVLTQSNQGFSKAVNLGLKQAKGEYVFLLNPDTRIIGKCIQYLYDFANQNPTLGAVAPQLKDLDGKTQASAFHFPTIFNAIRAYFFGQKKYFGKYIPSRKLTQIDVAVMAAFFVPKLVFDKLGPLDERFFLYYEDIEFCQRLRRAKLPLYYYPKAQVKHAHGASGNFKSHLHSPLARSAEIYHGRVYSQILNLVLRLGQKWQKIKAGRFIR